MSSQLRRFLQVDVFTAQPLKGNPLAVVVDAEGLSEEQMAALRKQMFENYLDEQKRIDSILTPQQREQLQRTWGG